jgi:uncharacterized protein with beta-barrel porin domain
MYRFAGVRRTVYSNILRLCASFIVNGATPAKNSPLTSAGAKLRLANGVVLLDKFDGEFGSHSSTRRAIYGNSRPSRRPT